MWRTVLDLLVLVPVALIFYTKERALIIAPPIALLCAAVFLWNVRGILASRQRELIHAGAMCVVLVELTWAFGYWSVLPLVGAAGIWLAYYIMGGLAQLNLAGAVDQQAAREYAFVSLVGVLVVLASMPWQP